MTNIILCGGSGTRLWPISRTLMPKQFVRLFDKSSLFELTIKRNSKFCSNTMIVSNQEQYFLALDQLEYNSKPIIQNTQFLLEPIGRNTAPAIALACITIDPQEIVLVTPSDHLIKNEKEYKKVLDKAKKLATKDNLVTFGITPTFAETGFGYVEYVVGNEKLEGYDVKKFHEKPDIDTAKKYIEKNTTHYPLPTTHYLWNSGMFMFKAGVFLDELKMYSPEIYKTSLLAYNNAKKNNIIRINYDDMASIPEDSIDYAVLEKSCKVKVVPSDIQWSDVGSFDALANEDFELNNNNNLNNLIQIDSKNNFCYSSDKIKVIATIGLEDFIIIDTNDALLIAKKGQTQKVKKIVNRLKTNHLSLLTTHLLVHRPWGTYETLIEDDGYKIKRIIVKPHKRLSLQSHRYRNEHWVVVSGIANITLNSDIFVLNANQSTYIKAGDKHRLSNDTNKPLVIIEAQVGSYMGEDDIQRFEDDFDRN